MKKLLLAFTLFLGFNSAQAQTINCMDMCVLGMTLDTVGANELNVTIYNGDTNHVNYPTVVVVNSTGDTVGNINNIYYLFAHMPGDTVVHTIPTTLDSISGAFTGTVYFTDQIWDTTCVFVYPLTCTVGVPEIASSNSVSVYPNPASGDFTVSLTKAGNATASITIYDVSGKAVKSYNTASNQLLINRDGLQSGLYFITVVVGDHLSTRKLIVK
ncbi:MAG: hypothetical protein K0S44_2960 [Bacteroidetes bacterium]|jgi:hypothetical protein|nr:hypothetical protein [Bacteroidota bacterium]